MKDNQGTRINKFLSEIGHCSRREADKLIEQGRVTINGKIPSVGSKVGYRDKVKVDGQMVSKVYEKPVFLAFNKPIGIVSTTDTKGERNNIIDYVNYPTRIFPIGRLDKESEGLIFLTNDGDIVNKILRARNNHEKEYLVTVTKTITPDFIKKMAGGIPILGTTTRKCKVEMVSSNMFSIVLTQGLNLQIRRMCEYLGYGVQKLKRTRIMNIKLDVPEGQWRDLTDEELEQINQLVSSSSKTQKKAAPAKKSVGNAKKTPSKSGKPYAQSGNKNTRGKFKPGASKSFGSKKSSPKSGGRRRSR